MADATILDEEFRKIIVEMKPHARLLPHKSEERHRITLWIKKLLDLKTQKRERNAYAGLLLKMLKKRKLESPFLENPPAGPIRMPETQPVLSWGQRTLSPNDLDSLLMSVHKEDDHPITHPSASSATGNHTSVHHRNQASTGQYLSEYTQASDSYSYGGGHMRGSRVRESEPALASRSAKLASSQGASVTAHSRSTGYTSAAGYPYSHSDSHERAQPPPLSWNGEFPLSSVRESGFQPRWTSTMSTSKEGTGHHHRRAPDISGDSLESNGEDFTAQWAQHDLSFSDEGSMNGDASDVATLLQAKPRPRTQLLATSPPPKSMHYSSSSTYAPRVSFTSSLSRSTHSHSHAASPKKLDVSRELLQVREVELKVKSAETRFQEERLRLQRQHEESLKHILDRKNNELEDLRAEQRIRVHQLETQGKRLERRASQLEQECNSLREHRDHHLSQTRHSSQQSRQMLQAEFDKKLSAAITDFEREKLELEQRHSKEVARVLEEGGVRASRLEAEYSAQARANSEVISELERRVQELTREAHSVAHTHSRLAQDKVALEGKCASLESQLQETRDSATRLEQECREAGEERESQLRQLQTTMDQRAAELQHQHAIQEAKTAEQVTQLEYQVSQLQQALEDSRRRHEAQTVELEASYQQEMREKELQVDKKLTALKAEMKEKEIGAHQKQLRLTNSLGEYEQQLAELKEAQELQSRQAERAIEEFKAQVEQQTSEMFEQMRGELERVEAELAQSRAQSERLSREADRLRQEERKKGEMELLKSQRRHKQELARVRQDHQWQLQALRRELEKSKEAALAKLSSSLAETEAQARARADHDAKVTSSLQSQLQRLEGELGGWRERHNRELAEAGRRAEEEKQTAVRILEAAVSKLKAQLEKQRAKLKEEHKAELHSLTEKHHRRVHQMEHDFAMQTAQTSENLSSLQTQVTYLQEDLERQQRSHEDQVSELAKRSKEESSSLKHHHETAMKGLQQEADAAHAMVSQLEARIRQLQVENESKLSHLKLQYESRMKGMMPATVKQEYEDTIRSLKAQVSILSQRASILQEELDRRRPTRTPNFLGSPHKTTFPLSSPPTTTTISR